MGDVVTVCVNSLGVILLGGVVSLGGVVVLGNVIGYYFKFDRCDVHSFGCDADVATGTDTEIIGTDLVCDHTTDAGPEPTNTVSLCLVGEFEIHVHE